MSEMLRVIASSLDPKLRTVLWRQYFELKSSLTKDSGFNELSAEKKLFTEDLLALAIFHSNVIVPLHGAKNFVLAARKFGATSVKLGDSVLGSEYAATASKSTTEFFAILRAYGLTVGDLAVCTGRDLVQRVLAWKPTHDQPN